MSPFHFMRRVRLCRMPSPADAAFSNPNSTLHISVHSLLKQSGQQLLRLLARRGSPLIYL